MVTKNYVAVVVGAALVLVPLLSPSPARAGNSDCKRFTAAMRSMNAELAKDDSDENKVRSYLATIVAEAAKCLNDADRDGEPDDTEAAANLSKAKKKRLNAIPDSRHNNPHAGGCVGLKGTQLCVRNAQCVDGICTNGRCAVGSRGVGCARSGGDGSGCHPPGHCTASVNSRLHSKYHRTCLGPVTCARGFAAGVAGCANLKRRLQKNIDCRQQRLDLMNGCYLGGDDRHKAVVNDLAVHIAACRTEIRNRRCP